METGSRGVGMNISDAKCIRFCVRKIDEAEMAFVKAALLEMNYLLGAWWSGDFCGLVGINELPILGRAQPV